MQLRFSLRQLMGFVVIVAMACAGLARPSPLTASIVFTFAVGTLFVAVLGAVGNRRAARAFWIGFAVTGWGYLWVAHWPDEDDWSITSPWELQTKGPLLTTKLLRTAFDAFHPPPPSPPGGRGFFSVPPQRGSTAEVPLLLGQIGGGIRRTAPPPPTFDYEAMQTAFFRAGHALWALVLGYLGGHLTQYFYLRNSLR